MTFNYNPLSSAIPPMHLIAPTAATTSFLPKLSAPQSSVAAAQHLVQQQQHQHHHQNNENRMSTAMDLENDKQPCDHSENCENAATSDLVFNAFNGQSFMMLMDPSLLGLQQFPILNLPQAVTAANSQQQQQQASQGEAKVGENVNQVVKEIIHCASCTLIPPNPNAPPATTRERPQGCRTVFVGGLPENITETIIHEIFERCGEITTLRLSKKNFCHIRFVFEASVDSAIYLSGYRVKIGNNNDPTNTGRLHVDYAQARDDQYEFECRQRQLQREQRHREKERFRSTSPPTIAHYNDHEATAVAERIKSEETFLKAVQILVTWLERGDCSKKNSNIFYSMIQSANSHIRRLLSEKSQFEEDFGEARSQYRKKIGKTIEQFTQIEKVFNAASHKKVWDHFTKAQRKSIDQWNKLAMDIRTFQLDENLDDSNSGNDDEMEMSDDELNSSKNAKKIKLEKSKRDSTRSSRSLSRDIKIECELKDQQKIESELKNKQIKVLQETIRNLQRKLLEISTKEKQNESKIAELEESIRESSVKELLLRTKIANARTISQSVDESSETSEKIEFTSSEAQLASLATAFLVIHPKGTSTEAILSYVQQFCASATENELTDVLVKHERIFAIDVDGNWHFCGFKGRPF